MDIKLVLESKAVWANGCPNCRFGIVRQGPLTGAVSLFEERMVQASRGEAEFCTCRAGHMARQYTRKVYSAMTEDGRRMCGEKVDFAINEILGLDKDALGAPTVHGEMAA